MSDKRYQVFISSTFTDLQEERRQVMQAVMNLDGIPAGMELFPAADEEQFEFIKKIIDDCDYYVIIIGGRYGQVSAAGISYTELEYDYAIKRGMKVLAFIHGDPMQIAIGKSEPDPAIREKLETFRKKVSEGRLVKFWKSVADLPGMVIVALSQTIKAHPAIGWVRGDIATAPELLSQINQLRQQNENLKNENSQLRKEAAPKTNPNLASGSDTTTIGGAYYSDFFRSSQTWSKKVSWDRLFGIVGPKVIGPVAYAALSTTISSSMEAEFGFSEKHFRLAESDFETIMLQLQALNLLKIYTAETTKGGVSVFCQLTEYGISYLTQVRAQKKSTKAAIRTEDS